VRISRCGVCRSTAHSPEKTMELFERDFQRTVQEYEKSPIVPVLNNMLAQLSVTPPRQPSVFVDLPDSLGDDRTLDARQMRLIIQDLEINYIFPSIHGSPIVRRAAASDPEAASRLAAQIDAHNRRIVDLRQIVEVMEHPKQE
jgi:hypothetical protein